MSHPQPPVAACIDQFIAAKVVAGLAPATIRTYRYRLDRYAGWLGDEPLSRWSIRQYIAQLQHEHLAPHTIAAYVRDIGVLCRWLVEEGMLATDVSAKLTPRVPKRRAAHYTVAQLHRLLAVCDARDRAMVIVLLDTGLRLSELCSMRWDRIDWETGQFTVVGKGNKERASWLSPTARTAITRYLATRSERDPALWYGRQGPLTPNGIHQVFRRRTVQAGIRADVRRLVHACRATFAKNYIKRGGSLGDLADLLGHSTLIMAAYYAAHAPPRRAAEVLQACVAKRGGPGLFYEMWHKGVWGRWKTYGKRVDNSLAVPLDDTDAGHTKYINGALGRYVRTGLEEPPPGEDATGTTEPEREWRDAERTSIDGWGPPGLRPMPALPDIAPPEDDPELAKYRNSVNVPPWMREGGDA